MSGISPRYYRDRLLRFWWLLLLCALCAGVGGWLGGALLFSVYSSTAMVQVDLRSTPSGASTAIIIDRMTHTSAQLAVSDGILAPIAARGRMSVASLRSEISAVPVANTALLSITVRDRDAGRSSRLANAVANAVVAAQTQGLAAINANSQAPYIAEIKALSTTVATLQNQLAQLGQPPSNPIQAAQLQGQLGGAQGQLTLTQGTLSRIQSLEAAQTTTLRVASPAPVSGTPVASHQIVTASAGFVFGVAIGVLLILGGDWLNARVRSPDGVEASFEWLRLGHARGVNGKTSQHRGIAELTQMLARDIQFLEIDKPLRMLALVSANPSTNTSELAARLANTIAHEGRHVLLVDGRLRDGAQHETFGLSLEPGLSNLISESNKTTPTIETAMRYVRQPGRNSDPHVRLIVAGSRPPNPTRMMRSNACAQALAAVAGLPADTILLDLAPALFSTDRETLASVLDGVIIVVDATTARKQAMATLNAALTASEAPVLGFVFMDGAGHKLRGTAPQPQVRAEARLVTR